MNITSSHFCWLGVALLTFGGATAGAADQPPAAACPPVAPQAFCVSPMSVEVPRRLPSVDFSAALLLGPGEGEEAPTEEGCFWVVNSPLSWDSDCDAAPLDGPCETPSPLPRGEPLRAEQLVGANLLDESGKLIQIAPDPPDPWCDDLFGRYAYHGSGEGGRSYWIPGSGDRMGIFALVIEPLRESDEDKTTFNLGATWQLVSGPKRTDMPSHLWDFTMIVGRRGRLDRCWSYDIAVRSGWFSDFEGSARRGLRSPGHAVLYYTPTDCFQLQMGVDCLDRDDIVCLPVFGAVFKPIPDFRLDAVFPRPRIAYRVGGQRWLYLAAEMGGGTWAIQRADTTNDVATYRDYRISLGLQDGDSATTFTEIGMVIGRHLEYRSGTPSYDPLNTTILRHVVCY